MNKQELDLLITERTATIDKVIAEAGESCDFSKVTSLKGTSEEKQKEFDKLTDERDKANKELKSILKLEKAAKKSAKIAKKSGQQIDLRSGKKGNENLETKDDEPRNLKKIKVPARARSCKAYFTKNEKLSYAVGNWAINTWGKKGNATRSTIEKAQNWCNDNLNMKALDEDFNETGGALVPYEFLPVLIDLKEQYGKMRANMAVVPMSRDVMPVPRRNAHVTATWVTNNQKPAESAPTFNNVELTARKLMSWISIPFELLEDSAIAIGDWVMRDMAWAFSKAEDDAIMLGDGTETYGNVIGFKNALLNLSGTVANIAGIQVASTDTWANISKNDIQALQGKLPAYALERAKFFCSSAFHFNVFQRLLYSQGGSPGVELRTGFDSRAERVFMYNGFDVVIMQNLPSIPDQATDMVCYFGDPDLGAKLGDRRQFSVATSDQVLFLNDQLAIKATERIGIAVHDYGNQSSTASLRVAGPMVALRTP